MYGCVEYTVLVWSFQFKEHSIFFEIKVNPNGVQLWNNIQKADNNDILMVYDSHLSHNVFIYIKW